MEISTSKKTKPIRDGENDDSGEADETRVDTPMRMGTQPAAEECLVSPIVGSTVGQKRARDDASVFCVLAHSVGIGRAGRHVHKATEEPQKGVRLLPCVKAKRKCDADDGKPPKRTVKKRKVTTEESPEREDGSSSMSFASSLKGFRSPQPTPPDAQSLIAKLARRLTWVII